MILAPIIFRKFYPHSTSKEKYTLQFHIQCSCKEILKNPTNISTQPNPHPLVRTTTAHHGNYTILDTIHIEREKQSGCKKKIKDRAKQPYVRKKNKVIEIIRTLIQFYINKVHIFPPSSLTT